MNKFTLLLLGLFLLAAANARGQSAQSVLVHRYENGYSLHSLEDNAAYLADSAGIHGVVAVRLCSKESMPLALSIAAADPFVITASLRVDYDFTPERILFLRSEDCLGSNPMLAATELWAVPQGAAPPASIESVRFDQVRLESIGTEASSTDNARIYRAARRKLIEKLRERPNAIGVVLGYYYREASPVMKRRLCETRNLLKQSGISANRYFVRLMPWIGERSITPSEPEPKSPSLFVIEVAQDDVRNDE